MNDIYEASKQNLVVGFTSVVGDLLHAGHVMMLNECRLYCDYLVVGIISDPTIDRPEKNAPVQSLYERYCEVASCKAVDEVIPLTGESDLLMAVSSLPIDIRFVGDDYKNKDFTGRDVCWQRGIKIVYNNRLHGLSSSELRERIEHEYCSRQDRLKTNI